MLLPITWNHFLGAASILSRIKIEEEEEEARLWVIALLQGHLEESSPHSHPMQVVGAHSILAGSLLAILFACSGFSGTAQGYATAGSVPQQSHRDRVDPDTIFTGVCVCGSAGRKFARVHVYVIAYLDNQSSITTPLPVSLLYTPFPFTFQPDPMNARNHDLALSFSL